MLPVLGVAGTERWPLSLLLNELGTTAGDEDDFPLYKLVAELSIPLEDYVHIVEQKSCSSAIL